MPLIAPNPLLPAIHSSAGLEPQPVLSAPRLLAFWHLASLDAPTVAVVWSIAFAWTVHIALPPWIVILLGLATWSIYSVDRVLDARRGLRTGRMNGLRPCHRFHWRHRRVFLLLALAAAIAGTAIILLYMAPIAIERDSMLAAATLAYFTGVHSPRPSAQDGRLSSFRLRFSSLAIELPVGLLFAAGCILPALSQASMLRPLSLLALGMPAAYFALLAWMNYYSIHRWETRGPQPVFLPASLLAAFGLLLASFLAFTQPRSAALIAAGACSAGLLAILDRQRHRLAPLLLRAAADLVLLTPVFLTPVLLTPVLLIPVLRLLR